MAIMSASYAPMRKRKAMICGRLRRVVPFVLRQSHLPCRVMNEKSTLRRCVPFLFSLRTSDREDTDDSPRF